jgi:hypothetical protein
LKTRIAIFFSILFLSLLVAPSIISLNEDSIDISFFLDINEEEEENKGKEESKVDSKLKIYPTTFVIFKLLKTYVFSQKTMFLGRLKLLLLRQNLYCNSNSYKKSIFLY